VHFPLRITAITAFHKSTSTTPFLPNRAGLLTSTYLEVMHVTQAKAGYADVAITQEQVCSFMGCQNMSFCWSAMISCQCLPVGRFYVLSIAPVPELPLYCHPPSQGRGHQRAGGSGQRV
jgi:hypothetical protein